MHLSPDNIITLVAAGLAFAASILAVIISAYNARFRRFAMEKWWDRKAEAYARVIESLVTLTYALDRWLEYEYREQVDPYAPPQKLQQGIRSEYSKSKNHLERVATEGNYVLSDKAASALSDLIKHFRQEEDGGFQQGPTLSEELVSDLKAATSCLKIVREEAKSDLKVK